MTWPKKIGGRD